MSRDCVKRLVEQHKLDKNEAKKLVKDVDNVVKRLVKKGYDLDEATEKTIAHRTRNVVENVAKERANAARNLIISANIDNAISNFFNSGLSLVDSYRALLESVNKPVEGGRASFDTSQNALISIFFSHMMTRLDSAGLTPLLNSKTISDDIGRELWNKSLKAGRATENKSAQEIADIIFQTREMQRKMANSYGADIGQVEGYIMPQRHDQHLMYKAGKEKWINDIKPLLDEDRTFGGEYEDLDAALSAAYDAMVTGIRLNDPIVRDAKLFQFSGPANLAKRMSQSRELHFKDYDSWKKWNESYGMRDLNDGILDAIAYDSQNIALMQMFGTNPEAMLTNSLKRMKEKYRSKLAQTGEKGIDGKVKAAIDNAIGTNRIPDNPTLAKITADIKMFNNVTLLGGAVISAITDIPLKAFEYRYQGKSFISGFARAMADNAALLTSEKDVKHFYKLSSVYSESMISNVGARISMQDNLSRRASKVERMFFKLNGLARWTDRHKLAMHRTMMHDLALIKSKAFASLPDDTKRIFNQYGINESDWKQIKKAVTKLDDGREYVMAELLDDFAVKQKLVGYLVDRTNVGVITPGLREERILKAGTQAGTPMGSFMSLMMQFKSFPVSIITKVWGREVYGHGKADIQGLALMTLMSGVFGYMAMTAKDALKNKTPRDPAKLETIYAALAQGGGLGILGDVLLQDGAGFGKSFAGIAGGPTLSRVDDIFKLYSAAARGEFSGAQALRTGISYIPGQNLFYVRPALDQILLLQMQEMISPGYLNRVETNMKKVYGQEFLIEP